MKIDIDEILKLPVTTNKIQVILNKEKFFSSYSIISYYSIDKDFKNLAYEQLSDIPFVSVCGLNARWSDSSFSAKRFFVLSEKEKAGDVLSSLRKYDTIRSKIDDLEEYETRTQMRIISSLAINSIGELRAGKMMYNNGSLILCDDKNFLVNKSRKELVCLKIEVNEYLNLIARTVTFSNPKDEVQLHKHELCVFQVSKDVNGQWWSGLAVKPVVLTKTKIDTKNLKSYFIQKSRFSDKHNIIPYWPYNPEDYTHGRLFAISQVVDLVNSRFKDLLNIEFTDNRVLLYDAYKPQKEMLAFLNTYLSGKRIFFDDPFDNALSHSLIKKMKTEFQLVMDNKLEFPLKQRPGDLLIKLCEPQDADMTQSHYMKSLYRMALSGRVLQHKIFYNSEKEDNFSKSEARRILIELLVKDCLIKRRIPTELNELIKNWDFYRYKIHDGYVLGASLSSNADDEITIKEFGFSDNQDKEDIETFAIKYLNYFESEKICGARDYMALKKNGNVYLIIDTDEIPILDVTLIDDAYGEIVNNGKPLSMFKRKKVAHKYLRGYIGFHLWESEGIDGNTASFSYISGINSENMQIMKNTKMDRMPRARRIFVLHSDTPSNINTDIEQIENMLRFGFGRWNEMMTYPFPFKFLQEYLDDVCEVSFSKHWSDIRFK